MLEGFVWSDADVWLECFPQTLSSHWEQTIVFAVFLLLIVFIILAKGGLKNLKDLFKHPGKSWGPKRERMGKWFWED